MPVYRLPEALVFPPPAKAARGGLLGVGGDLSVERLLLAYRSGIFPWYSDGEPILWWSPDPRSVLFPGELRVTASMRRILRKNPFRVTYDQAFREVMLHCGRVERKGADGTWITAEMVEAYGRLHAAGHAHSVEVWQGDELAGGLYGVALGRAFFGESMFTKVSNASKVGFITLATQLREEGFTLIDCQVHTEHLASLGARDIPRRQFLALLAEALDHPSLNGNWEALLGPARPAAAARAAQAPADGPP